jgi:predicted DNA-binding transcriptional regulator YafY
MEPDEPPRRTDADRRLRQADRLARLLRVLELIQGRGRTGVREIAAELGCSERTVFRDLNALELAKVPYDHDREAGGLRVRPGFRFPALDLTDDERVGQATAAVVSSAQGLDVTAGAGPVTRMLRVTSLEEAARLLAEVIGSLRCST